MLLSCCSYRDFLSVEYLRRSKANPHYSQRAFAKQLGLSAGELSEVLRGKRKLSLKSALRIARSLSLNEAEREHLITLIHAQKSKEWEAELGDSGRAGVRDPLAVRQLSLDMFAVVSEWYCFAILTLSETESFRWDENWIAKRLGIAPMQARIAIHRLERLGLIEKKRGKYRVVENYVLSPDGIPSEAIRNYHRQVLEMASRALEFQGVAEREISGITMAINPKFISAIKKEMALFLDGIAERYGAGKKPQEVYQLEMAFFRLSEGG
jgi:uncharacterized protein (TIGR02147 family)